VTSVDDLLGPSSRRYLTGAVQQVRRTVRQVAIRAGTDGRVRVSAVAAIDDPRTRTEGWAPHLDSVDTGLIAAELTECALAGGLGLDPEARRRARVRRIDLWAGSRPERRLTGIPVSAELLAGQVRGQVGPMRFRLVVDLDGDPAPVEVSEGVVDSSTDLLGDPETRYWGLGFLRSEREVRDVAIDPWRRSVTAAVTVGEPPGSCPDGLESAHRPGLTPLDGLFVVAQLTKALICTLDGVDPADRETMWARRTTCEVDPAARPVAGAEPVVLTTEHTEVVELNGRRWQNHRMAGSIGALRGSFAFANRVPGA